MPSNITRAVVALATIAASALAAAQSFPSKPIRFLVPYPPGGGTDIVARAVGVKLQEAMGQPVLVENRPGGSEIIATDLLAKAPPDGHTIGLVTNTFPINVTLMPKLPYDSARDFAAVSNLVSVPFMLVAHPAVPANSVRELVDLAKKQPGKLNYASLGSGSPHGLAMEWFKHLAGLDIVAVPYKGVAPAMTAVAAGEVPLMFTGLTAGMAQVRAGKLKAIAATPARRIAAQPDLPTIAESGYPEFDLTTWYGVMVPAATPADVVQKLNTEIVKALNAADVKQRFGAVGIDPAPSTAAEFATLVRNEIAMWARVIKATGAKAE
jgi:tripartite-type tricarboxylate transporter receptor subunit TctC